VAGVPPITAALAQVERPRTDEELVLLQRRATQNNQKRLTWDMSLYLL